MPTSSLHTSQNNAAPSGTGMLEINVTSSLGFIPIKNAKISISVTEQPDTIIEQVTTDESGRTELIDLPAPPVEYSLEPSEVRPYSEYNLMIESQDYEPVLISGTQLLADTKALQPVSLIPKETEEAPEEIVTIPDHTLYGNYPPKIPEDEIKPMDESGEIVLSRVVIPEYVIVHAGEPDDSSAPNYYVRYKDYIKNVVSSEIYPTWPEESIYANTLAILSFTMNRVYTEW